ncbi:MAG: RidA family protein [Clostridiales bacterium]|nr:RidA family protein [Clostridiales bacterium]
MKIERFDGTGRMSRVVKYGDMLFLSGVTAGGEGVEAQTAAVLARIEELLGQHGSDKEHILSTTIYLKDIGDFTAMNSVWDPWVAKGNEPARACVEAALAAPSIRVEMSVVAAVKE